MPKLLVTYGTVFRVTSHTGLRAHDHCTFMHSHCWKENAEPVQVCFTLHLRDQRSMWMQDGCKVYADSYMATHGSCFMVTWIIFKNYFLEVGLTQNLETMALRTLTTIDFFYFIMCEDPHEYKFVEIAFSWGPSHIWLHTTLEGACPHYMILEMSCDSIWTLSFGLSQFHGHDSWLVCEAALRCAYVQVTSIDWPNEIHTLNKTLSLSHTHI